MSAQELYGLPTSLTIGGVKYALRSDFRAVLDVLMAYNDPELDDESKAIVMLKILLPYFSEIPLEEWWDRVTLDVFQDACKKCCDFIDCGQKDDGKDHPRVIDWEKDAGIIIPAVNSVAHMEIRAMPNLHWWTFFAYFMEIRESLFSSVLNIRQKKAKHQKLEKWEQDFYKENRALIDMETQDTEEIRAEKESILRWL